MMCTVFIILWYLSQRHSGIYMDAIDKGLGGAMV